MSLSTLMPFLEAAAALQRRKVLPTNLTSAELRELSAAVRQNSFFSAQTTIEELLQQYKSDINSLLNPVTVQREDRITKNNPQGNVTQGIDFATARLNAKKLLQQMDYKPEEGKEGTLQDLSSDKRINLVLKTNKQQANAIGQVVQGNQPDVVEAFPAWELRRFEGRIQERNWKDRFRIAAQDSGDLAALRAMEKSGRMVALKNSPLWDSLGSSALFEDALDTNFEPFAFGSGMGRIAVSYDDAKELGLPVDEAQPVKLDFENLFGTESEAA